MATKETAHGKIKPTLSNNQKSNKELTQPTLLPQVWILSLLFLILILLPQLSYGFKLIYTDRHIDSKLVLSNTPEHIHCTLVLSNTPEPIHCTLEITNTHEPIYCTLKIHFLICRYTHSHSLWIDQASKDLQS